LLRIQQWNLSIRACADKLSSGKEPQIAPMTQMKVSQGRPLPFEAVASGKGS
jgi:hypothetical protein